MAPDTQNVNTFDPTKEPRAIVEHSLDILKANFEGQSAAYWGYEETGNPYNIVTQPDLHSVWAYARRTYHNPAE